MLPPLSTNNFLYRFCWKISFTSLHGALLPLNHWELYKSLFCVDPIPLSLWSPPPARLLLCCNHCHTYYNKRERSLWAKGEKTWTDFFMLILNFVFFNYVHRIIVDISAPRLSLAPPLIPSCGQPLMILRYPFLILCRVTFCQQGNPCLSTIPESSSISNAKRTNAGAPWAKDIRASNFNAVESFILCGNFTVPFSLDT